jgi:outer membrane lipoprotein-sorting protein
MKLLLVPVLLAALGQAGDDAEKRFKAMEEKLARAAAFQVTFDGKIESAGQKNDGTLKGALTVGPNGKSHMTAEGNILGKAQKMTMVSDGKQRVVKADDMNMESRDVPSNWRKMLDTVAARIGVTAGFLLIGRSSDDKEDPLETIKVSDFKQVKREKINGRDAVVIEYKLTPKGLNAATCTVWVDAQTNLPLKRTLHVAEGGGVTISETYSNFTLNPNLDDKMFELPK